MRDAQRARMDQAHLLARCVAGNDDGAAVPHRPRKPATLRARRPEPLKARAHHERQLVQRDRDRDAVERRKGEHRRMEDIKRLGRVTQRQSSTICLHPSLADRA